MLGRRFSTVLYFLLVTSCQARIRYENWQLLAISGSERNLQKINLIRDLEINDNFRLIRHTPVGLEVAVSPRVNQSDFITYLGVNNLTTELLVSNIERLINDRMKSRRSRSLNGDAYGRYMNWDEMENYILKLERMFPHSIKKEILGRTFEGRNIYMFTISSSSSEFLKCHSTEKNIGSSNSLNRRTHEPNYDYFSPLFTSATPDLSAIGMEYEYGYRIRPKRQVSRPLLRNLNTMSNATHNFFLLNFSRLFNHNNYIPLVSSSQQLQRTNSVEKPVIFIDGGSHSREWITPAAVIYLMEYLAQTPSLTDKIEWKIIPNVNPDGYVHSWEEDRFWRKTRSVTPDVKCKGVDLNRNFGHRWGEVDTSPYACSENYGGTKEFSEIEAQLLRDALYKVKSRLKVYLSIHNWGQDLLHPYSSSQEDPQTLDSLKSVGQGMSSYIYKQEGVKYRSGKSSVLLYPASGTAIDWVYDNLQQPLTYLIELRDKLGLLGFILPESYIKPTSRDLVAAASYLASVVMQNYTKCS